MSERPIPHQNTFIQEISEEAIQTPSTYHLSVAEGARCVELKRKLGKQPARLQGVKRGTVDTYSRQSRNTFLKKLLAINYPSMGNPAFYTLTYPGMYSEDPRQWKRDLHLFFVRLTKEYPDTSATWRLEPQRRGAPHFCGFLWGVKDMDTIEGKRKFSQLWYDVVGSGDERHLRAGTQIDANCDTIQKIYYQAKYQTKEEKGTKKESFDYPVGRYWGFIGRSRIKSHLEEIEIPQSMYFKVRRILRQKLSKRTNRKRYQEIIKGSEAGLWAEMSDKAILKLMNWIIDEEEKEPPIEIRKARIEKMTELEEYEQEQVMKRYERKKEKKMKKGAEGERVERARATRNENELVWMMKR